MGYVCHRDLYISWHIELFVFFYQTAGHYFWLRFEITVHEVSLQKIDMIEEISRKLVALRVLKHINCI